MKLLCKVTLVWLLLGLASCALTTPEATSAPSSSSSYRNGHEIISLRQFVERYEGLGPIAVTIWEKHLFTIQPIGTRDCDAEQVQCHRDCMEKAPPWPRRTNGWDHNSYCRGKCLTLYMECLAENAATETFESAAEAATWLARHPEVAAKTTFVIAAGIVFVVMTDGAGLALVALSQTAGR